MDLLRNRGKIPGARSVSPRSVSPLSSPRPPAIWRTWFWDQVRRKSTPVPPRHPHPEGRRSLRLEGWAARDGVCGPCFETALRAPRAMRAAGMTRGGAPDFAPLTLLPYIDRTQRQEKACEHNPIDLPLRLPLPDHPRQGKRKGQDTGQDSLPGPARPEDRPAAAGENVNPS